MSANPDEIEEFAVNFAAKMKEPLSIGPERRQVLARELASALREKLEEEEAEQKLNRPRDHRED
ncbi:MAG: hypothetical protein HYT12_03985 [Candidatus Liptonbacteria bacterium]|nr:hypothetical protein [Candidatus Liptonbacteria bacterium]